MAAPKPPEKREEQKKKRWYETTRGHISLSMEGLLLYLLIGIVLWWALDCYIAPGTSTQRKDLVQALALIMAGIAGAIGVYFTWRGQRITQESLEDTRKHTEENLRLTREGQITERFTRAIDQLGAADDKGEKPYEIRLGGIYALERIARDSEQDHWPIMEVLTAYVRQHARWSLDSRTTAVASNKTNAVTALAPDIQAILTVLRRRTRSFHQGEPERLILHERDLSGADLTEVNLSGADLNYVNLGGAILRGAILPGTFFQETFLVGADLYRANLEGAVLSQAILRKAILAEAFLKEAYLYEADLQGAYFDRKTELFAANLTGARLQDVHVGHRTELSQEQLDWAIGDMETALPDSLVRPATWDKSVEEQTQILNKRRLQQMHDGYPHNLGQH